MKSGTLFRGDICLLSLHTGYLDRYFRILLPLARVDMSASTLRGGIVPSVRFMHDETHVARLAVRRQAEVCEGFLMVVYVTPISASGAPARL